MIQSFFENDMKLYFPESPDIPQAVIFSRFDGCRRSPALAMPISRRCRLLGLGRAGNTARPIATKSVKIKTASMIPLFCLFCSTIETTIRIRNVAY